MECPQPIAQTLPHTRSIGSHKDRLQWAHGLHRIELLPQLIQERRLQLPDLATSLVQVELEVVQRDVNPVRQPIRGLGALGGDLVSRGGLR